MAIRYNFVTGRFRDSNGRYVSRASGLKSSTGRAQYQAAQRAEAAGIRAQQLTVEIVTKITRRPSPEEAIITITDLDIRPPETIEENFLIEYDAFDDDYFNDLDVEIDSEDQYGEDTTK